MKTAEIRSKFLNYFARNGHEIVESSPLVPQNDPTLLFTNAGMVQFKDVFTGNDKRSYTRATTAQKCVRAGGKHNDLENVGFTARHHTFFEMLGNFSFGDYFKKDAIRFGWEFVTKELGLPKHQLYVTVHLDDDEAADIWHKQEKIPKERISRFDADNFWAMGDTGPCGPCSEIFVDRGKKYGCKKPDCKVGCECDRFIEIWNLVFMQFERSKDGKMTPLPKPSVDTGAGLERIASVIQNVESNYDIDSFVEIMEKTGKLAGKKYQPKPNDPVTTAFRVIADHSRATAFLIGDGVLPSNEGRGYVLRRIMRRAIRYGKQLGLNKPFLFETTQFVIDQMSKVYPDLEKQRAFIKKAVKAEEEQFFKTLERGLSLLDEALADVGKKKTLSGEIAFKLYDTYGFPVDLTRIIAKEKGISVDEKGFEKCMERQKSESRKHWKGSGQEGLNPVYQTLAQKIKTKFTGYESLEEKSECLALLNDKDEIVSEIKAPAKGQAVFKTTPYYGESGGQVGDQGSLSGEGLDAIVTDVQKPVPELVVVHLDAKKGSIKKGKKYLQTVDSQVRNLTMRNHTATHLLHWALRTVLGDHVKQAGSLVAPDLLRFDFSHFQPVTPQELQKIEDMINEKIWLNDPVSKKEMDKDAAIKAGAIAFFGEKYGKKVRVVKVGDFSTELCGGTHVGNASEIHFFKIVSEGGIAAGVRRIVAYTSKGAFDYLRSRDQSFTQVRDTLKATSDEDVRAKLEKLLAKEKELRKQVEKIQAQQAGGEVDRLIQSASHKNGQVVITHLCPPDSGGVKKLREMSDQIRQKEPSAVLVLGMKDPEKNKAMLLAAVGPKIDKSLRSAVKLIQELSPHIEGRGGGKPDQAQAGGTNVEGLEKAIAHAKKLLTQ